MTQVVARSYLENSHTCVLFINGTMIKLKNKVLEGCEDGKCDTEHKNPLQLLIVKTFWCKSAPYENNPSHRNSTISAYKFIPNQVLTTTFATRRSLFTVYAQADVIGISLSSFTQGYCTVEFSPLFQYYWYLPKDS